MAGLPVRRAWVSVGPPLLARGPSEEPRVGYTEMGGPLVGGLQLSSSA
jgi:hypothetical protein